MRIKQQKRSRGNRRLKEPFLKRAKRTSVRALKIIFILAALPGAFFGFRYGYTKIKTTPYLAIETINVQGTARLSREEIIELSGVQEGDNLFSFKSNDVIENIKQNPWVKEASISRGLPDTLNIKVVERQPLALVKLDELYVMDSGGIVFKKLSVEDELDLPVITGLTRDGLSQDRKGLQDSALGLIKGLKGRSGFNLNNVSEVHVDPVFGLSLVTLEDGIRLDIGTGAFEEKLAAFEKVVRARGSSLGGVEAIDLNNSREVVVRFTTNVIREGEAHGQKG